MGKTLDAIDAPLAEFIGKQHVFFVATAPLEAGGHINLSPKGLSALRVLEPRRVAYLDYVGSGVETIAHIRQNGRIVVLFCAFDGPPKIVRLHGTAVSVEAPDARFDELVAAHFEPNPAARAVIVIDVERVSTSCGYGVPLYDYRGERDQLGKWAEKKGGSGLREYQIKNNSRSIDGLEGLAWAQREHKA